MKYRLNVAAILRNGAGKILIGERKDRSGAWQFPQGGVDEGETLAQALVRELREEICRVTGIPRPVEFEDEVVGLVEYRDGSIIDVIRKVAE